MRSVVVCGIISSLGWLLLTIVSRGAPEGVISTLNLLTGNLFSDEIVKAGNGFDIENDNDEMPTILYLALHFFLFLIALIPTVALLRNGAAPAKDRRRVLCAIFLFGMTFRLVLIPSTPIHENDFYRYIWDGRSSAAGVNPYLFAPAEISKEADPIGSLFTNPTSNVSVPDDLNERQRAALDRLVELRKDHSKIHSRIGHPHIPTIYPPVAQGIFYISEGKLNGGIIGWKVTAVCFDLGICLLLIALLSASGRDPQLFIVYAWSPLVIKELANSGHYDSLPIFFTLLAIYLAINSRHIFSTIALAIGTLAKFFPVALLPVINPPSTNLWTWMRYVLFLVIVLAAFIPFLLWQNAGFSRVFAGLGAYGEDWQFFSGLFAAVHRAITVLNPEATFTLSKIITGCLLLGFVSYVVFSERFRQGPTGGILRRSFYISAALFLCNPCAFPWYFTWVIPFLCFFPQPAWIFLGGLLPLTYLSFRSAELAPFAHDFWLGFPPLSWIIWGSFVAALIISKLLKRAPTH